MDITEIEIKTNLKNALDDLINNDKDLIEEKWDVHERAITHKLGCYLQKYFDLSVDCEYNRKGISKNIKEIPRKYLKDCLSKEDKDVNGSKNIYPDIIIHKRGNNDHNLLAIEFKKGFKENDRAKDEKCDTKKLNAIVKEYEYKYAIFIDLKRYLEKDEVKFIKSNKHNKRWCKFVDET
ncbi:MAG: hypothetical protein LBM96_04030 [Methanobrevibacter sp.]|jgi:hypothetical protein|nr:hypothetical protein [Candidatus Methanoflexus mossambicus]